MASQTKQAWGKARPFFLPSGQRVVAHRLSIFTLMSRGLIPDHLTAMAVAVAENRAQQETKTPEFYRTLSSLVDFCVTQCLDEPKVYDDAVAGSNGSAPPEDAMPVSQIPDGEKMFLFQFCMGAIPVPTGWYEEERERIRAEAAAAQARAAEEARAKLAAVQEPQSPPADMTGLPTEVVPPVSTGDAPEDIPDLATFHPIGEGSDPGSGGGSVEATPSGDGGTPGVGA